jgi:hypothetical protein
LTLGDFRDREDRDVSARFERHRIGRGLDMNKAQAASGTIFGDERGHFRAGPRESGVHIAMLEAENIAFRMPRQLCDRRQARCLLEHEGAIFGGRAAKASSRHA